MEQQWENVGQENVGPLISEGQNWKMDNAKIEDQNRGDVTWFCLGSSPFPDLDFQRTHPKKELQNSALQNANYNNSQVCVPATWNESPSQLSQNDFACSLKAATWL